MNFDDGLLKIYSIKNTAPAGDKPVYGLVYHSGHYFGYETIGITRHYTAMKANSRISELVHILQDRSINGTHICILEDGLQYKCSFVQHKRDDTTGLDVTVITLERLGEDYAISEDQ